MPLLSKSSRLIERPIYRKKGHTSILVDFFRLVLGMTVNMIKINRKSRTKEKKRIFYSNAKYHLTTKQVQKLICTCRSGRDKLLIQLMAYTGIRRAEIADLDISDIRWNEGLILICHGKGNKQRLVPLPPFVVNDLKSLIGKKTSGAVFESRKGGNICYRQLNRIVADIGNRANVMNPNPNQRNITCHLLRHTFARIWKRNRGSMESLSYILGHSSQTTTMDLYGKESISDMKDNYNAIYRKIQTINNSSN